MELKCFQDNEKLSLKRTFISTLSLSFNYSKKEKQLQRNTVKKIKFIRLGEKIISKLIVFFLLNPWNLFPITELLPSPTQSVDCTTEWGVPSPWRSAGGRILLLLLSTCAGSGAVVGWNPSWVHWDRRQDNWPQSMTLKTVRRSPDVPAEGRGLRPPTMRKSTTRTADWEERRQSHKRNIHIGKRSNYVEKLNVNLELKNRCRFRREYVSLNMLEKKGLLILKAFT